MAKRKTGRRGRARASASPRRAARRRVSRAKTRHKGSPRRRKRGAKAKKQTRAQTVKKATTGARVKAIARRATGSSRKVPRLDRARRTLTETTMTLPSSLNVERHGTAARTGAAELRNSIEKHTGMTPALTGGDIDADWENAYFSGDEAPGGDNPTPDQEVVEEIGKSLGVEYQDDEELKSSDKVAERDKHRWELDPASSEDYKERK